MHEEYLGIKWQTFGETVLNPYALAFTIVMYVLIIAVQRRYALLPFIAIAIFITEMQRVVIAGADFSMLRIAIVASFVRIVARSEFKGFKLTAIDKLMLWFTALGIINYTILLQTGGAFINRLGNAFEILGTYFACRLFIRSFDDLNSSVKSIIIMSIPFALCMINEQLTGRNLFSALGGVPEYTFVREGRLRAQGAFSHPILAGTFGASLIALVMGYWWQNRKKIVLTIAGFTAAAVITFASASSGPIITCLAACSGLLFWRFRGYMRSIVWGAVAMIILLQLSMKAPVWWVINRIPLVGGSTAAHRAQLIDAFLDKFSEWWLIGTQSYGYWGWGLEDITNEYIFVAIHGGLIYLVLFILIIVRCFKIVGQVVKNPAYDVCHRKYLWAIGAYLFAHAVSFMSVSYFGQIVFFWYMTLAIISNAYILLSGEQRINE